MLQIYNCLTKEGNWRSGPGKDGKNLNFPPSAPLRHQQQGLHRASTTSRFTGSATCRSHYRVTVEGHPVKCLSMFEMEEHRWLGLSFNCNEKFGCGHNQVCQHLFLLDGGG